MTVSVLRGALRLQVFGSCTGILPSSASEGSLAHLDFYLFCMKGLAGKKPLQTLFTDDDKVEILGVRSCSDLRSRAMHPQFTQCSCDVPPVQGCTAGRGLCQTLWTHAGVWTRETCYKPRMAIRWGAHTEQ